MAQEGRIEEFHGARFVDLIEGKSERERKREQSFSARNKEERKEETNLNLSVFDEHLNESVDRDEKIGVERVPMLLVLETV